VRTMPGKVLLLGRSPACRIFSDPLEMSPWVINGPRNIQTRLALAPSTQVLSLKRIMKRYPLCSEPYPYSIISSAVAKKLCGKAIPGVFAVFGFFTSSN